MEGSMAKASDLYVDVSAGQYLFREGDTGAEMYIVESGSMAILRAARGGEPLAVLEPGDFLGEMAVLEDQPRFASAVAKTDCRLLRIERSAFAELLRQNVEIAVRIMRKLALRQRRAEQRVSELQQELARLLSEALMNLPRTDRLLFLLSAEGHTSVELAEEFGLSHDAVRSRLKRVRKHLRVALERVDTLISVASTEGLNPSLE